MFTGYIENIVTLDNLTKKGNMNLLKLKLQKNMPDVKIGESISLNGVCLTVKYAEKNILTFEITEETLSRANIGSIKKTGLINMERAMKAGDRFNGHIVYGHIDGTRKIQSTNFYGKNKYIDVGMSKKDMFFLVNKGSIAIDGISLTIGNILENKIRIFLIEHTINKTNLITRKAGDHVNVEFDIILKMASKVSMPKNILTKEFLEICGY